MDTMDAMKKRILLKDYRNRLNNTINTADSIVTITALIITPAKDKGVFPLRIKKGLR